MNTFIATARHEDKLILSEEESWHCSRVLRMKPGEGIRVIDGKGAAWLADLLTVNDKACVAEIRSEENTIKRNYSLHIAIAPTKNMDRTEWFAEKATELGVDEISFFICKNSERKVIKTDRIRKICESAVKQSMQATLPLVHDAVSFSVFLNSIKNFSGKRLIAHCEETKKADIQGEVQNAGRVLILIGPEGDFSADEIKTTLENGFIPVTLGETRLRTETAGVYAAAVLRTLTR